MNGRGNQIVIKHHWLSHFKRYYRDRDYSKEDLIEERDYRMDNDPDDPGQAKENRIRLQAINDLLDRYE